MKNAWKYLFSFMLLVLVVIWTEIAKSPASSDVKLYFFDVGQGEGALIEKGDFQILIDGGPDDSVLRGLGEAMPITDRKIEIMILTHPHADHLVGLNQILNRYQVEKIYLSGVAHTSNQYLEFLNLIKDKKIESIVPARGLEIVPFENSRFTFLWPGDEYRGKGSCDSGNSDNATKFSGEQGSDCIENLNNTSVVTSFCYFEQCSLYLGDLQNDEQAKMMDAVGADQLRAQILKISHHGSSNGTSEALLKQVLPTYAVISVGAKNTYGHPHIATMNLLDGIKLPDGSAIKTLRTDRNGTVIFTVSSTATNLQN